MITSVYYYKNLGQYNLCSNEKSWCINFSLQTDDGLRLNISETWDEDAEPDTDGRLPSEVLDLIEARLESYWINTRREETRAKIAQVRGFGDELDSVWLRHRIAAKEKELTNLRFQLDLIENP